MLKADGFDRAIIGSTYVNHEEVLVYSADECIRVLMDERGMLFEYAVDYFEYNVEGAYVGPLTPIFVWSRNDVN